jgi:hypothetical protein
MSTPLDAANAARLVVGCRRPHDLTRAERLAEHKAERLAVRERRAALDQAADELLALRDQAAAERRAAAAAKRRAAATATRERKRITARAHQAKKRAERPLDLPPTRFLEIYRAKRAERLSQEIYGGQS